MPKIEYITEVTEEQDVKLIKIAEGMGLSDSTGVLDLISILIEAEIERYDHEN